MAKPLSFQVPAVKTSRAAWQWPLASSSRRLLLWAALTAAVAACVAPAYESEYRLLLARGTAADHESYLRRHPNSPYAEEVRRRIPQLAEEQATRERIARETRDRIAREEQERRAAAEAARAQALARAREGHDIVALLKLREDHAAIGVLFARIGQPLPAEQAERLTKALAQATEGIASMEGSHAVAMRGRSVNDLLATAEFSEVYFYKDKGLLYFESGRVDELRFRRIGLYGGRLYALPAPVVR